MRLILLTFLFFCSAELFTSSAEAQELEGKKTETRVMLHTLSAVHWGLSVVPIVAEHEQPGFHVFGAFCNLTGMLLSYLAGSAENSTFGEKVVSWGMIGIHGFTGFVNILGIVQNTPMPESSWELGFVGSVDGGMVQISGEL